MNPPGSSLRRGRPATRWTAPVCARASQADTPSGREPVSQGFVGQDGRVSLDVDLDTVKTWALILGIGLPILGVVLAIVVKSVLMKVLFLVLCLGLATAVWSQRTALLDYVENCAGTATFFGIDVSVPRAVQQTCSGTGE
jgi:hypothetical protein